MQKIIKVKLFCLITLLLLVIASCIENQPLKPKIDHPQVQIGTQIWMKSNLDVDKFKNGDLILECKSQEEWDKANENKIPAWCYYDFASFNGKNYGKLYNWFAVSDPRGLAPDGWHIPSDKEWLQLISYLGASDAGFKLKSSSEWRNNPGSDAVKFKGLPGGSEPHYNDEIIGYVGNWWTSTEDDYYSESEQEYLYAKYVSLNSLDEVKISYQKKYFAFSVRCIKGNDKNNHKHHPRYIKNTMSNCQSDYDLDGVCDIDDKCPDTAGPVENGGCPVDNDLDDDGVLNDIDLCPEKFGLASNNGCPLSKEDKIKKTINDNINKPSEIGKPNGTGDGDNPFGTGGQGGRGSGGFGTATGPEGDGDGTICDNTPTNLNSIINLLKNNVPVTQPTSVTITIKIKADGSISSVTVTGLRGAEASVQKKIKEIVSKSLCTKCNLKNKNSRSYTFPKIILKQD
jgi:uncharacterized protein (TIGR02145 family)